MKYNKIKFKTLNTPLKSKKIFQYTIVYIQTHLILSGQLILPLNYPETNSQQTILRKWVLMQSEHEEKGKERNKEFNNPRISIAAKELTSSFVGVFENPTDRVIFFLFTLNTSAEKATRLIQE